MKPLPCIQKTVLFLVCIVGIVFFSALQAQTAKANSVRDKKISKVKTAFIYNFTKYIYWPKEDLMTEFCICVIGSPVLSAEMDELASIAKFRNRLPIKVISCKSVGELKPCQMVIVDGSDAQDLWALYSKLRGKGVLMIAENLLDYKKAMVSFTEVDGKMKYILNKTKLDESNLVINDLLFKLSITKAGEWKSIFEKFNSILKSKDNFVKVEKGELQQILNMYGSLEKEKLSKESVIHRLEDSVSTQVKLLEEKIAESKKIGDEITAQKRTLEIQQQKLNLQKEELIIQDTEITKQKFVIMVIATLSLIGMLLLVLTIRSNRQKRQANKQLFEKKAEIELQKHLLELKQEEILDSINYAKRIQTALMANDKLLSDNLPEFFVLFKPKDIVAGDFYWAAALPDSFIYATADSTGHGVPGAFMSLLNISKLNEAVRQKNITRPDLILNDVRKNIIAVLNPAGSAQESKDGMDAILCDIDLRKLKLRSAAANNSLCIIRGTETITVKADKMPVGKSHDDTRPFTLNETNLQKGDVIYTTTDGFGDQFGGEKGKKFKQIRLKELFAQIAHEPMAKQREILEVSFDDWKGELEQVDDVLIIGVRV